MSKLYVTEYIGLMPSPPGATGQVPIEPPLAEQVVDYSGGAAATSAFQATTRVVRLHTDAICSVLFGTNPTATTTKQRMAANQTEYKGVPVGQSYKVSAVTNT